MSNNTTSADPTLWSRIRQATGTVYGDIGTSVLYTIMEITREAVLFKHHASGGVAAAELVQTGGKDLLSRNDLLGSLSLVVWSLIFLTVKYDLIVMRGGWYICVAEFIESASRKDLCKQRCQLVGCLCSGIARGRRDHHAADQYVRRIRAPRSPDLARLDADLLGRSVQGSMAWDE